MLMKLHLLYLYRFEKRHIINFEKLLGGVKLWITSVLYISVMAHLIA